MNEINGCPVDFYADGMAYSFGGVDLSSSNIEVTAESDRVRIKVWMSLPGIYLCPKLTIARRELHCSIPIHSPLWM